MLIPRLMKGLLKSTTRSRSAMIVSGAIARSASCVHNVYKVHNNDILIEKRSGRTKKDVHIGRLYCGVVQKSKSAGN